MPFSSDNGKPGQTPQGQYDEPLLRLGGLWPSKSGKAIMGNIPVAEPRPARRGETPTNVPFGEVLIDMIKQCIEDKKPLRFLIFESQRQGVNLPPYTINLTIGQPRTTRPGEAAPTPRKSTWGVPAAVPLPDDEDSPDEDAPEPTPRPIRRGAPRR